MSLNQTTRAESVFEVLVSDRILQRSDFVARQMLAQCSSHEDTSCLRLLLEIEYMLHDMFDPSDISLLFWYIIIVYNWYD